MEGSSLSRLSRGSRRRAESIEELLAELTILRDILRKEVADVHNLTVKQAELIETLLVKKARLKELTIVPASRGLYRFERSRDRNSLTARYQPEKITTDRGERVHYLDKLSNEGQSEKSAANKD